MKYEKYEMKDGNTITIPCPTCYKDCVLLLQSDYYRIFGKMYGFMSMWLKSLFSRTLKVHFWFRMASYKGVFWPICILKHHSNLRKFDLVLSAKQKVGWGFYTGQTTTMFINQASIIGNNVNLGHVSTIASNCSKSAVVGDNVYIAPFSCLVEGVQVGNNSLIGTGSVVVKDIPADSTAVGSPAKVVGENKHPKFIRYPWPCEKYNNC